MFLAGNKMEETKNKTAKNITRKKKILSKKIKRKKLLPFYDQVQAQGQIKSNNCKVYGNLVSVIEIKREVLQLLVKKRGLV